MQTIEHLNRQFGLPNTFRFEAGNGGLARVVITNAQAEAHVYLYGAHVTHYQPHGQKPVLFLSRKAFFVPGKPIRGGVPVCFPWFGNKEDDPQAAMHGTVRLREWDVESASADRLVLRTREAPFEVRHIITVRDSLTMAIEVRNTGKETARFEEALHTYFAVSDVRNVAIEGLAGAEYLDKTEGFKRKREGDGLMRLTQEPDRLYLNTKTTCIVDDPGWQRKIVVEKQNSDSTVVWNPWEKRAAALPDFAPEEWPGMLCIETVNARENAVTLPAGKTHTMTATVRLV
jgi:glucose-6-phosphate 1-epimerase